MGKNSTCVSRYVNTPRARVYSALVDAIAKWKVPTRTGKMTAHTDADGGIDVLAVHDGLPPGLSTADNETGWRTALAKLAALVEAG